MVSIIEVTDKAQLRRFVDYPNELYKDVPQFVPATYGDDLSDWDRSKNPAFEYCDARCWLAMRDGEIVGRIGAIHSRKANDKWVPTACALPRWISLTTRRSPPPCSARWRPGRRSWTAPPVHGPLGFTDMDREGMLVEGFDRRSCFFTYYNYPYYIDHMAALGYVKDVDWIEELITVPEDEATIQRWEKISDFVLKRHRLHIHEARSRLSYLPLLKPFFELVNLAYAPLYGTVDLSDRQIKKYSAKFAPLINPNTTCFVMDENDRMVAFGVGAPSLASALQKHRGRLMPTGWIDVLKAFHRNDTVDLLLIAVHPDYQKKGVNAIILSKAMKGCHKLGIKQAETGPMLELNDKVQSQWKDFQAEQHKRRRCFIKQL